MNCFSHLYICSDTNNLKNSKGFNRVSCSFYDLFVMLVSLISIYIRHRCIDKLNKY